MHRKLVLGVGLAGLLAGPSVAQFAADRVPPTAPVSPAPFGGVAPPADPGVYRPATPAPTPPAAYVPPVGGVQPTGGVAPLPGGVLPAGYTPAPGGVRPLPASAPPINTDIRAALPPDHPWLLRPEHGAYFICVKSYSRPSQPTPDDNGPSARVLAEALAAEIRDTYRVQAFLHEHISEERKAEMAAVVAARERGRLLAAQWDAQRQKSQLQGMEFIEPDNRIRYKTVNYRDQIAVLVGGFQTDEDARKAIDKVRMWSSPKDNKLMDGAAVVRPGPDGKPVLEKGYMNPYLTATVVPNPTGPRKAQPAAQSQTVTLEPFVVKLNEGRPYNLLKATKGWTLAVKSFAAPVQISTRDGDGGAMRKPSASKTGDILVAGAEHAEEMARALRGMKDSEGRPLNLEAFVLHTRSNSFVTVGQFDGPNDPALFQVKHLLSTMTVKVSRDSTGSQLVTNTPSLFGTMTPIPIPRP